MRQALEETFLTYRGKRWLWISLIAAAALIGSYLDYRRRMLPHGGTLMGLLYGLLGTVIILILMALGIRKRRYDSGIGTLQGWTSAHVYLGLLVLLIIPLHAGFKFRLDFHTLAFVLLAAVVVSGIVGVVLYVSIPSRLTRHEAGLQADKVDREINRLLADMRDLAKDKSDVFVRVYSDEVAKTVGHKPRGWRLLVSGPGGDPVAKRAEELARIVPQIPPKEHAEFQTLTKLMLQKSQLEANLLSQMRLRNALESWLYIHLPVSLAMLAAVVVHIVFVFYY
jgi:hypothetical protein